MTVTAGRIYESTPPGTLRVLVDRLWPRGISREAAPWDLWLKEGAPSTGLRRWYHANPQSIAEFHRRYRQELAMPEPLLAVERLAALAREQPVALLTASREVSHSQVPVLKEAVLARLA